MVVAAAEAPEQSKQKVPHLLQAEQAAIQSRLAVMQAVHDGNFLTSPVHSFDVALKDLGVGYQTLTTREIPVPLGQRLTAIPLTAAKVVCDAISIPINTGESMFNLGGRFLGAVSGIGKPEARPAAKSQAQPQAKVAAHH